MVDAAERDGDGSGEMVVVTPVWSRRNEGHVTQWLANDLLFELSSPARRPSRLQSVYLPVPRPHVPLSLSTSQPNPSQARCRLLGRTRPSHARTSRFQPNPPRSWPRRSTAAPSSQKWHLLLLLPPRQAPTPARREPTPLATGKCFPSPPCSTRRRLFCPRPFPLHYIAITPVTPIPEP